MTRLRNLDYTICKICGCVSNYTPCPQCLKAEAEREAEQPKRVVMVQHADGRVEIDDTRPGYIVNPAVQMWGWLESNDLPEDTPKDWNDTKGDCAL